MISYRLSMRRRSSVTAYQCLSAAEKSCKATKANVHKSQSPSSVDRIASRQTLTAVHTESAKDKIP